jgi:hypothetical protein
MNTTQNANNDTSSEMDKQYMGNNAALMVLLTPTAVCCFHMTARALCVCVCVCVCVRARARACVRACARASVCYISSVSPLKNSENNSVKCKVR